MREPDMQKLDELVGRLVNDVGAAMSGALVVLGDQVGIYRAMADGTPRTAAELAALTDIRERYLQEWLSAQAASGYVTFDEDGQKFSLTPEQAMIFADQDSPAYFVGAFDIVQSMWIDEPKVADAFRNGRGLGWHEHSNCLFRGTERFFRTGYNTHLVADWIPSLAGVEERLSKGGRVADIGCGHGASTILMAKAFPAARFTGFDYHGPSIDRANEAARDAGLADRVTFLQSPASDYSGEGYDLVTMFDCLHDMGDPVGAARHVRDTLAEGGTWMIVEPFAHDRLKDNLNPVGRVYYNASTMICTPASLSQDVGLGLGAQAGEMRLRKVALEAGFQHFRRTTETPFNMVFEARSTSQAKPH